MSQFDNSEVMKNFANILAPQKKTASVKTAAGSDFGEAMVTTVASEAAFLVAAKIGLAALSGTAFAAGKGAALVAGLGMVASVGAWPIAALLLGAGVLYECTRLANDNIEDLIERFKDLDPESAGGKKSIQEVIERLTAISEALGVHGVPESPEEKVQQSKNKIKALDGATEYVKSIKPWFMTELKPDLSDWSYGGVISGDAEQAEKALDGTLEALIDLKTKAAAAQKKTMRAAVAKYGEVVKKDLSKLGTEVLSMHKKLEQKYGGPPKFDNNAEQQGFDLAKSLADKSAKLSDVKNHMQELIMLKSLFDKALAAPAKKAANTSHLLSKRALTLGDGTRVTPTGIGRSDRTKGPRGQGVSQKRRPGRSNVVMNIQKSLNKIHSDNKTGVSSIAVDGIYGPRTGESMQHVSTTYPELGITNTDYRTVGRDVQALGRMNAVLTRAVSAPASMPVSNQQVAPPQDQLGGKDTAVQYGGGRYDIMEQPNKWNPTSAEILAALNNKFIDGVPATVWMDNRGLSRQQQVDLLKKTHLGPNGIPPAMEWSMPVLKNHVERTQIGRSRFI